MQYILNTTTLNGTPINNGDGTYTQSVTVITNIVGAYAGKFLQTDTISVVLNGTQSLEVSQTQITNEAVAFILATYPDTI